MLKFEIFSNGSREGVIFSTVFSTLTLMSIIVILPILHINFQEKLSAILINVEQCKVSFLNFFIEISFL